MTCPSCGDAGIVAAGKSGISIGLDQLNTLPGIMLGQPCRNPQTGIVTRLVVDDNDRCPQAFQFGQQGFQAIDDEMRRFVIDDDDTKIEHIID